MIGWIFCFFFLFMIKRTFGRGKYIKWIKMNRKTKHGKRKGER